MSKLLSSSFLILYVLFTSGYCNKFRQASLGRRLHDNTSYEYGDFSILFHQRGSAFTQSHFSLFYQWKLIMHVDCGHAIFGKHSKLSTMCYRNATVLIDVEVRILLTFRVSMMAKECLYQKYVSIFLCLHLKSWHFSSIHFKVSSLVSRFRSLCFACAFSLFSCS